MAQNTPTVRRRRRGITSGELRLPRKGPERNLPLDGAGGFQIGSTMKPFVFAEWLNSGRSMATVLDGSVRVYPAGYPWKNTCGTTTGSYDPALGQNPCPMTTPTTTTR